MNRTLALLSFALLAVALSSCSSANSSGGTGEYYAPDPGTPLDRTSAFQQEVGSIKRSGIL